MHVSFLFTKMEVAKDTHGTDHQRENKTNLIEDVMRQ